MSKNGGYVGPYERKDRVVWGFSHMEHLTRSPSASRSGKFKIVGR
jgi:hypothetical protein